MSKRTKLLNRAFALCLSCTIIACSFALLTGVTASADEGAETDFFNRWFSAANNGNWWDCNTNRPYADRGDAWDIENGASSWTYRFLWGNGSARVDCNGPGLTVNLDETNQVNYTVTVSRNVCLYVQVYRLNNGKIDDSSRSFIELAQLSAGENNGSINLFKNSKIKAMLDSENKIFISGFGFGLKSFEWNETVTVNTFSIAKGEAKTDIDGFSRWFVSSNNGNWWDGNTNRSYADRGDAWDIETEADSWTYKYFWSADGKGNGRLDCNGPGLEFNLNSEYNTVNYSINVSNPVTLYAQAYKSENGNVDYNSRTFIPLTEFDKGEWSGSCDLRASKELSDMKSESGSLLIAGFGFKTHDFVNGDTITVNNLTLTYNKNEYKPSVVKHTESWILNNMSSAWWSWDWNLSDSDTSRLSADTDSKGGITVSFKGDFEDLRYMAAAYTVDLKTDPYFYARFDTDIPCKLYMLVSDSAEGNNGILISDKVYSGKVNEKLRISDIEALAPYIKGNSISVYGFRLIPQDDPTGKKIYFRTMDFGDMNFGIDLETVNRPTAPTLTADTKEITESVNITVSGIPESAQLVQYRIGKYGEWFEYTAPVTIKKNVEIFARYIDESGNWSISGSLSVSNIKKNVSEDSKPVIPNWFSPDTLTSCWYNWDWRYGSDDQNRFALDATDSYWTAQINQDWCKRIETQHNNSDFHSVIDLDEQTELFYKIDTQFALKISLKIKKGNVNSPYATVEIGRLTNGKNSGSFNLSENAELLSLSDDDNKLTVSGVIFEFTTSVGNCFTVERFLFDAEDAYYPGYDGQSNVREVTTDWFDHDNTYKWLNDTKIINDSDDAAKVEINTDNDWCATINNAAGVKNITSNGSAVRTNLNAANTLYLNADSDYEADVMLGIRFNGNVTFVKVGELKTGKNELAINLNAVNGLEALSNNGSLSVTAVRFVPKNTSDGDELKVDLFAFNAAGKNYPGYENTEKQNADKKAAEEVDTLIRAIGTVTESSKKAIETARKAYEKLTSEQRALVTEYQTLTEAENRYYSLMLEKGSTAEEIPIDTILSYIAENPSATVEINLTDANKISKTLLAAAKNNNCDLKINTYGKNGELIYSIVIPSNFITDTSSDFDTGVYTAGDPDGNIGKLIKKRLSGEKRLNYSMNADNKIASYLILMLNGAESLFETAAAELYNYSVGENRLTLLSDFSTVKENSVTLLISCGGKFLLTEKNIGGTAGNISGGNLNLPQTGERSMAQIAVLNFLSIAALAVLTLKVKRGENNEKICQ